MRDGNGKEVFVFLPGMNFWEGLFDNVNLKYLKVLRGILEARFAHVLMTIFVPPGSAPDRLRILEDKERAIREIFRGTGPTVDFLHVGGRTAGSLRDALGELRRRTAPYDGRFVWATNYFNGFLGAMLKERMPRTRLHWELMGLAPEEELLYSRSSLLSRVPKFLILRSFGRVSAGKADSVSAVSRRFRGYLASRYRLEPSRIRVIPCFYDDEVFFPDEEQRARHRKRLGIGERQKLLLYSGMLQKWQMPQLLFSFFRRMQDQDARGELRFMAATFDRERALEYAARYGIRELIVECAGGAELNGLYNAADMGIATRSDDWVSKVSSPVKIPEYLATGNSVLLLESIGDHGSDLRNRKYALVKKDPEDLLNTPIEEILRCERPDPRDLELIRDEYGVRRYLPTFREILEAPSA